MAKTKKQKHYVGKIPFDIFGNQLHYPESDYHELKAENFREDGVYVNTYHYPDDIWKKVFFQDQVVKFEEPKVTRWDYDKKGVKEVIGSIDNVEIDNYVFEDTLTYKGYSRGRSAAYFQLESVKTGRQYTVFLTDLEPIINNMHYGKITGKFTFCKRGANFGLMLVDGVL